MIYVHVPFCRSFCTYCDFYSEIASGCGMADFEKALVEEVRARSREIAGNGGPGSQVSTLYIGGGTPSVLPLSVLESLLDALREAGAGAGFEEFTVEVNPEDIVEKGHAYVEGLMRLGVNRVSMGVQSFDDGILRWMNRRHNGERARKAYSILEEAGVGNISIDLIFGLPQLSVPLWRETMEKALDISGKGLMPKHISSYQLSVEPGSALARMVESGRCGEASEELCAEQYAVLCETLAAAGYNHYEISNFALPGFEAVHNSAYWRHVPYVGLGPGAHSLVSGTGFGDGAEFVRKWNSQDLRSYIEASRIGDFSCVSEKECLSGEQLSIERLMLGLRTAEGVRDEDLQEICREEVLSKALSRGDLVRMPDGHSRIPEDRFFVSDSIISSLL